MTEAFRATSAWRTARSAAAGDVWVFFDVLEIIPARDRTLDEVRDEVVDGLDGSGNENADRRQGECAVRSPERAAPRSRRSPPRSARPVQTVENVKRSAPPATLERQRRRARLSPARRATSPTPRATAPERILLKVDRVIAPAFFAEAADAEAIQAAGVARRCTNDLLPTYNRQLLEPARHSINNVAYQQLTGQAQTQ